MKLLYAVVLLSSFGIATVAHASEGDKKRAAAAAKLYVFPKSADTMKAFLDKQAGMSYWNEKGVTKGLSDKLAGTSVNEKDLEKAALQGLAPLNLPLPTLIASLMNVTAALESCGSSSSEDTE